MTDTRPSTTQLPPPRPAGFDGSHFVTAPGSASALAVVVCGVGSHELLPQLFNTLPPATDVAYLVFPDVRRGFASLLCKRPRADSAALAEVVTEESPLLPGHVYIVPMEANARVRPAEPDIPAAVCLQPESENADRRGSRLQECCRSAVEAFGSRTIGVLLSSLAGDATQAMGVIHDAGGQVFVQDTDSALVFDGVQLAELPGLEDCVKPMWALGGCIRRVVEAY